MYHLTLLQQSSWLPINVGYNCNEGLVVGTVVQVACVLFCKVWMLGGDAAHISLGYLQAAQWLQDLVFDTS